VARDRKRARQRRPRHVREGASAPTQNGPVRADLPGSLDHVGGVDEFDAALIRGAGGVPAEQVVSEQEGETSQTAERAELVPAGGGGGGRRGRRRPGEEEGPEDDAFGDEAAVEVRPSAQPKGNRAIAFLRASWAELQRVQWPDRRQVSQATAVVLGFVAVAGAYLGAADWVAQKIVNFILS
jgi:preprotein translocase subunit SecE